MKNAMIICCFVTMLIIGYQTEAVSLKRGCKNDAAEAVVAHENDVMRSHEDVAKRVLVPPGGCKYISLVLTNGETREMNGVQLHCSNGNIEYVAI
eukprot:gene11937-13173_t